MAKGNGNEVATGHAGIGGDCGGIGMRERGLKNGHEMGEGLMPAKAISISIWPTMELDTRGQPTKEGGRWCGKLLP